MFIIINTNLQSIDVMLLIEIIIVLFLCDHVNLSSHLASAQ